MVLQEVDLVDIEEAAVGPRQQARLERLLALRQRPLKIDLGKAFTRWTTTGSN